MLVTITEITPPELSVPKDLLLRTYALWCVNVDHVRNILSFSISNYQQLCSFVVTFYLPIRQSTADQNTHQQKLRQFVYLWQSHIQSLLLNLCMYLPFHWRRSRFRSTRQDRIDVLVCVEEYIAIYCKRHDTSHQNQLVVQTQMTWLWTLSQSEWCV